ncbi:unknown [Spodoptera litura nucleopolyhedrovirus II]|uniref:hypothetical protein n=1 Tax=Spodoptera litura nucleopolyhedrovirus II TaxID=566270 RepID=UPI000187464B|nr:hypothetical protein SlnV2_gp013 [Spodoptera litura nucleopolyhedrovirus II]ACI47382.1 unknown [Spodoptera litura nucleopolyhedrovirus II]
MMYSPSSSSRYYRMNCNDDVVVSASDAAAMRHDLRTLKSQVYEVCRQSAADHNLCERIRSSIDINNLYYSSSPRYNLGSSNSSTAAVTKTVLDNNKNNNATVTVVDTVKY